MTCLREKEPELSGACRDKIQADALKAKRLVEEFGRSCRADVDQFCAGVDPGGGRIIGCLDQHQPELSSSCQAEMSRLAEARERVSALRTACKADAERVCKGVPAKAGPLRECLQANEANLSAECNPEDIRRPVEAASVVDVVEEMSSQEHIRESLQILQGLDSVAFSRSQILLQFDSYQALQDKANGGRMLFNPQFVFGHRNEFSFQVKRPVAALYPYAAGALTQFGLGAVSTALAWNFLGEGRVRQYLAMGCKCRPRRRPRSAAPGRSCLPTPSGPPCSAGSRSPPRSSGLGPSVRAAVTQN